MLPLSPGPGSTAATIWELVFPTEKLIAIKLNKNKSYTYLNIGILMLIFVPHFNPIPRNPCSQLILRRGG